MLNIDTLQLILANECLLNDMYKVLPYVCKTWNKVRKNIYKRCHKTRMIREMQWSTIEIILCGGYKTSYEQIIMKQHYRKNKTILQARKADIHSHYLINVIYTIGKTIAINNRKSYTNALKSWYVKRIIIRNITRNWSYILICEQKVWKITSSKFNKHTYELKSHGEQYPLLVSESVKFILSETNYIPQNMLFLIMENYNLLKK